MPTWGQRLVFYYDLTRELVENIFFHLEVGIALVLVWLIMCTNFFRKCPLKASLLTKQINERYISIHSLLINECGWIMLTIKE